MKWTSKDTALAIELALATGLMVGIYGYIAYRSLQMGGWF